MFVCIRITSFRRRRELQRILEEQREQLQQARGTLSSGIAYGPRDTCVCVCRKGPLPPRETRAAPFLRPQSLYPLFSSMQLDRKNSFFWNKSGLGSRRHRSGGALAQHLPVFVSRHITQTPPFSHPGIRLRVPVQRCDQDLFGMCRGIAARNGRGCAGVPAQLPGWKFSGSALAELSTGSIYLLHVCGLRDDVMRNLFTCASVLQKKEKKLVPKCGICENKQTFRLCAYIVRFCKGVHWLFLLFSSFFWRFGSMTSSSG